jgi:hypothetical protein
MAGLLQRYVASADQRLVLLAPVHASVPRFFRDITADTSAHADLLAEVQRLRGRVYLNDGAIRTSDLTPDGRHETAEDDRAWHLIVMGPLGVTACVWYLGRNNARSIDELRVRSCPLREVNGWRNAVTRAIEAELARARRERLDYVELGGWAVAHEHRHSGEGLLLALTAYGLGRAFGGALGLTTATVRHASSTILRRLGGSSLEVDGTVVPAYFDQRYDCEMELLRFDSRAPNPKYAPLIDALEERLRAVPVVICREKIDVTVDAPAFTWQRALASPGGVAA